MAHLQPAYIVDCVRIPRARIGKEGSAYAGLNSCDLLKPLFNALTQRNPLDPDQINDVILGCSTQVGGQGANIAKIASLYAGWSHQTSGATINRFCCSGLDAINLAATKLMTGLESVVVAGGIEHSSAVPMFSDKGAWFSDPKVMKQTGFLHMGLAADLIATQNQYDRTRLDELAIQSHERALSAQSKGYFNRSLIPVKDEKNEVRLEQDNAVRESLNLDKLAQLPASFIGYLERGQKVIDQVYDTQVQALHSPGNSPALVDGASLVLLANEDAVNSLNLKPRAKVTYCANGSDEPIKMLTGHIRATEKLLKATNKKASDIDLWEVNESFASSVMNFRDHFEIDNDKLNVNGSAIALGHPLGATGGNLLGTLLDELERRDLSSGIVSICGGAGVGVSTFIERC